MKKLLQIITIFSVGLCTPLQSAVSVTVEQVGDDVVLTWKGALFLEEHARPRLTPGLAGTSVTADMEGFYGEDGTGQDGKNYLPIIWSTDLVDITQYGGSTDGDIHFTNISSTGSHGWSYPQHIKFASETFHEDGRYYKYTMDGTTTFSNMTINQLFGDILQNGQVKVVELREGGAVPGQDNYVAFHLPGDFKGDLDYVPGKEAKIISSPIMTTTGDGIGYDVSGSEVEEYRSTSLSKTLDRDGDNAYGSDGSFFYGNGANANSNTDNTPSWLSVSMTTESVEYNTGFTTIDNPNLGVASTVSDWHSSIGRDSDSRPGYRKVMLEFFVHENAPRKFRVGILAGNHSSSDGRWNPESIHLYTPGTDEQAVTNLSPSEAGIVFFDVQLPDGEGAVFTVVTTVRDNGRNTKGTSIAGLLIDVAMPAVFKNWLTSYNLTYTDAFISTGDQDGTPNILEYVLDGDPTRNDRESVLPSISPSNEYRFTRRSDSTLGITQTVEYSTDLINWDEILVTGNDVGQEVTVTPAGDGTENVSVELPISDTPSGKCFVRLKVTPN